MTLLHWRPNMSLGVEDIDDDHKALIEVLNRLHYQMVAGDEPRQIESVFDELAAYCSRHFVREEALMEQCGYPDGEAHARMHLELADRLQRYRDEYHADAEGFDHAAFYDFLSEWLLVHVLEEDMKLAPYMRSRDKAAAQ